MFENLMQQVAQEIPQQPAVISIEKSPVLNAGLFYTKIGDMVNIEDRELYNILMASYDAILSDIFNRKDPVYLEVFTSQKFLSVLIQVMNSLPLINYNDVIYCNKLAYDYHTYKGNDPVIKELFFTLSKTVNKARVYQLMSTGLSEEIASYLAMARYSSFDENINVKRMNFVIITSDIKIMTAQTIVQIYEKLFDKITILFESIMFDIIDEEEDWLTDDTLEINSTINLAILAMIEDMPLASIERVLTMYTSDYIDRFNKERIEVRFSMKAISGDYPRILSIVEKLSSSCTYVP